MIPFGFLLHLSPLEATFVLDETEDADGQTRLGK